jgi:hypothetical protein
MEYYTHNNGSRQRQGEILAHNDFLGRNRIGGSSFTGLPLVLAPVEGKKRTAVKRFKPLHASRPHPPMVQQRLPFPLCRDCPGVGANFFPLRRITIVVSRLRRQGSGDVRPAARGALDPAPGSQSDGERKVESVSEEWAS